MADLIYKCMVLFMVLTVGAWVSDPSHQWPFVFQIVLLVQLTAGTVAACWHYVREAMEA